MLARSIRGAAEPTVRLSSEVQTDAKYTKLKDISVQRGTQALAGAAHDLPFIRTLYAALRIFKIDLMGTVAIHDTVGGPMRLDVDAVSQDRISIIESYSDCQ